MPGRVEVVVEVDVVVELEVEVDVEELVEVDVLLVDVDVEVDELVEVEVVVDVVVGTAWQVPSAAPVLQVSFAPVPPAISFQTQPVNVEQWQNSAPPFVTQ